MRPIRNYPTRFREGVSLVRCQSAFLLACSVLVPLAQGTAWGERYYVAPDGNDGANGSSQVPWQTLQRAADSVVPGDFVVVRPGVYAGFDLQSSGTPAEPITFFGLPGATIGEPNTRTPDGINLELASHVVVEGFEVTGMPRAGIRAVGLAEQPSSHVAIRNNHAHDNGVWGIFTGFVDDLLIEHNETSGSGDEHGIYVSNSGDRPLVRHNVVWGNNASGIQLNADASLGGDGLISGAVVEANRIFANGEAGGSAINLDGVQDSSIVNNLLYDNHASGISLFRIDGAQGSSGNLIAHNTVMQPTDGRWALNIQDGSTDNTVRNNILLNQHAFRGAIDISADSLNGFSSDYNGVLSRFTLDGGESVLSLGEWQTGAGQDAHTLVVNDTVFRAAAADDYRLAAMAAVVDAGILVPQLMLDLDGRRRIFGNAPDVGAYEWRPMEIAAADFDGSGVVDGDDLLDALLHFGVRFGAAVGHGDANADGAVNRADISQWRMSLNSGTNSVGAIPEPTSIGILIAISITGLICTFLSVCGAFG